MKRLALLTSVLGCFAVPPASAADYHVSPAGNDAYDGRTPKTAFRSLAAACRATPAGQHVIHVASGEYEETESCVLPPGVSLIGAGIGKSVFHWKAVRGLDENPMKFDFSGFMIQMKGSSDAAISGITIVGSLPDDQRAHGGIIAHEVRNVSIRDCELKGLEFTGVWLSKATNSSVDHCRFDDCGHPSKDSCSGALQVGELTDCAIHHNVIRENRGAYGIKTWMPTWTNPFDWGFFASNKVKLTRVRFHDNDVKVRQQGGWGNGQPNMAMELWNSDPVDCEIDRNRFNECLSLVEGAKSPKTIRVHHNLFILVPGYSYAIEAGHHNLEIDHNVFRNGFYPIASFGGTIDNLRIHHNTFDGIEDHGVCNLPGVTDFSFAHNTVVVKKDMNVLNIGGGDKPGHARHVTIANNLFVKEGEPPCAASIIRLRGGSTSEAVSLRDNAFWNWTPEGDAPMVADPLLERAADGDRLLRISTRSPVRAAGIGNLMGEVGQAAADPEAVFLSPPGSARPGVWWHWMGCNVTREGITRDLESFKDAGISGATIFGMADVCTPWAGHIENSPTDGLIAFTDPWWQLVRHAAAEGKRLGIDVGLHNCPGYTSSGGPWITPELSMQQIFVSRTPVEGGKAFIGVLPRPPVDPHGDTRFPVVNKQTGSLEKPIVEGRKTYWRDIAVLAVPAEGVIDKGQIQDLTGKMDAAGRIEWTPPAGQWMLYRFGHTAMGSLTQPNQWEAMGLECDKMSEDAVTFHVQHVLGELRKHLGPLVGDGLRHILLDSYEAGTPSWTPRMPEEFVLRRGYDLKAFLPTFAGRVVGGDDETAQFRRDFDRTIMDLYRDVCFATISRLLAEANLRFVCEPYGGPFRMDEVAPHVGRVMNEFWSGARFRPGGTMSGIFNAGDGRRHNILEAEAFTGHPDRSQWSETPAGLKRVGDGAFCAGINRLVLHTNPHQPWDDAYRPGMTMGWWGTHFGRTQTWWEPGKAWIAYLSRCQALLQWGEPYAGGVQTDGVAIQAIHRTDGAAHVYFLAHAGDGGRAVCSFGVSGLHPELWDPVRGAMRDLPEFQDDGDNTRVPLEFAPAQSWFVVFRKQTEDRGPQTGEKRTEKNFPSHVPVRSLAGPWEVQFDPKWGGPGGVLFDALTDWTCNTVAGIRYYSGTATYRKLFDLSDESGVHSPSSVVYLDLGTVNHIARVRLNGRDLGVAWTAPWGVPVPPGLLREQGNALEVEVSNVWANRLIGDEQESPDCEWQPGHRGNGGYLKRFPDWFVNGEPRPSKGRYCFVTWNYFTRDSPLVPSGLLGPVRLMSEE